MLFETLIKKLMQFLYKVCFKAVRSSQKSGLYYVKLNLIYNPQ